MPDFGVFISVPVESVTVRAVVGSLAALATVAMLLRIGLRVPRIRTAAATVPVLALVAVVVISWGDLLLPMVMVANDAVNALPVPIGNRFVPFAPIGWPILVGAWALVTSLRMIRRCRVMARMRHVARAGATSRDFRVQRLTIRLSRELRIHTPRVAIVEGCPGGAVVVGMRQPTLVIDAGLLTDLDDEELEGLLAHELAHVRRRDNLLAFVVGLVRDAFFFVPGGRWVARRLCVERELAADQTAVEVTARPGALASGLLKVIDSHQHPEACAAFAAPAAVVTRVERLVDDAGRPGRGRAVAESAVVAATLTLAVAVSVQLPATIAGQAGERDALALLWAWQASEPADVESTAFDVYRRSEAVDPPTLPATTEPAEPGQEFTPAVLRGERPLDVPSHHRVSTAAVDRNTLEMDLVERWRATPIVAADGAAVGVYLLQRPSDAR